jgi:hypothetical protein
LQGRILPYAELAGRKQNELIVLLPVFHLEKWFHKPILINMGSAVVNFVISNVG